MKPRCFAQASSWFRGRLRNPSPHPSKHPDHRSGSQPGRSRPAARHPVGAPRRRAGKRLANASRHRGSCRSTSQLAAELEQREMDRRLCNGSRPPPRQAIRCAAPLSLGPESGTLARQNLPEALRWYGRAAAKGDLAQTALARLKWTGQGLAKDQTGALALLHKASAAGYQDARRALAWHSPPPRIRAMMAPTPGPLQNPWPRRHPQLPFAVLAVAHAASGDFTEASTLAKARPPPPPTPNPSAGPPGL